MAPLSRARHARGPGAGRFLLPASLLALVVVALGVAWVTMQGRQGTVAVTDGAVPVATPSVTVSTPDPSVSTGSDALAPTSPATSSPTTASGTPSRSSATPSRSPSTTATRSPSSTPSTPARPSPSPTATIAPKAYRVVVYNATSVTGRAARTAARLQDAGWRVSEIGNWSSRPAGTTVYYPPGAKAAAQALATELGVDRIRPAYPALPSGRLVVVLG